MSNSTSAPRAVTILSGAGAMIRYSFYLVGLLVLGTLGLGVAYALSYMPRTINTEPSFRLTAPELASLPVTDSVTSNGWHGRSEARHYGQLYDRNRDLTVIMVMPPEGTPMARDLVQEVRTIPMMRKTRHALMSVYYDLETRFGEVRAMEMRVAADGRAKNCLAFLSRFDTAAVYLKGWLCEGSGVKANPDNVACLLHGLALERPLNSAQADAFLRGRIGRGSRCWSTPVTQTVDTRPVRRQRY